MHKSSLNFPKISSSPFSMFTTIFEVKSNPSKIKILTFWMSKKKKKNENKRWYKIGASSPTPQTVQKYNYSKTATSSRMSKIYSINSTWSTPTVNCDTLVGPWRKKKRKEAAENSRYSNCPDCTTEIFKEERIRVALKNVTGDRKVHPQQYFATRAKKERTMDRGTKERSSNAGNRSGKHR